MTNMPRFRRPLGPSARVAIGLVGLMVMLLLLSGALFHGFLPDPEEEARREHRASVQVLAAQVVAGLRGGASAADLGEALQLALRQDPSLRSAALQSDDGDVRVATSGHARAWTLDRDSPSTSSQVRAALSIDGRRWGELQVSFDAGGRAVLDGWLSSPLSKGIGLMAAMGFGVFYLYLRRAMVYLDPERAVPDSVRKALDILSEGVLVLDATERIVLANHAFIELAGGGPNPLGSPIGALGWLVTSVRASTGLLPWRQALDGGARCAPLDVRLETPRGVRHGILRCSAVEGGGRPQGCLLTLTDVTDLHERTRRLGETMAQLEASRQEVLRKNEELVLLATRDPLTGLMNRRAFVEQAAGLLSGAQQSNRPVSCIMCDIDHFKRVNDTHGHAGGDLVLQAAAKVLGRGLRMGDVLARFGGEEFCILLADATLPQALEIAERLRQDVERSVGPSLRQFESLRVTMSFGVEQLGRRAPGLDEALELADQALYRSKNAGRNRVSSADEP